MRLGSQFSFRLPTPRPRFCTSSPMLLMVLQGQHSGSSRPACPAHADPRSLQFCADTPVGSPSSTASLDSYLTSPSVCPGWRLIPPGPSSVTSNAVHLPSSHEPSGLKSVNRSDTAPPWRKSSEVPHSTWNHISIPRQTPNQPGADPGFTGARSSPEGAGGCLGPSTPSSPGGLAGGGCSEQ